MLRRLRLAFTIAAALLPIGAAAAQEATTQDDQQALQKSFAWAVEATRDYVAKVEGWSESDFTITLKVDNPDQPRRIVARVIRPGNPFSAFSECPISPPVCWNELHFAVEAKNIFYMVWGN